MFNFIRFFKDSIRSRKIWPNESGKPITWKDQRITRLAISLWSRSQFNGCQV